MTTAWILNSVLLKGMSTLCNSKASTMVKMLSLCFLNFFVCVIIGSTFLTEGMLGLRVRLAASNQSSAKAMDSRTGAKRAEVSIWELHIFNYIFVVSVAPLATSPRAKERMHVRCRLS